MKVRLLLAVLLVCLFSQLTLAQNQRIDDLRSRVDQADDTSRVKILAALGFEYAFIDSDTSRRYSRQAIALGQRIGFDRGEADGVNNLAISFDVLGVYDSSLYYFLQALRIYEGINHKPGIARVLNNVGMVYQNLDSTRKSLDHHIRSYRMEEELGDTLGAAYSMIHIANLFTDLGKRDSALYFYNRSVDLLTEQNDKSGLTYSYVGLGEFYVSQDPQLAIDYLIKAKNIYLELNNQAGLANANLLLGMAHQNLSPQDLVGIAYYQEALRLAKELGAKQVEALTLEKMAGWHEINGDLEEALAFFKQFKSLQDSIFNEEKASQITRIESQFESEKKDYQISILNANNRRQRELTYFLIGTTGIVLVLLGLLWRNYQGKIKALKLLVDKNREIKSKNREIEIERNNATQATKAKTNFLSVMSHEIRTPLNAIIGLTHLLIDYPDQGDRKKNLASLKFSAENLLALINDILDYSKLEEGKAEIEAIQFNLKEILERILNSFAFKADEKQIRLKAKYDADLPQIVTGDPTRFSQVLNNLLANAVKFTDVGSVTLDVDVLEPGKIQFGVIDTGIGIPSDKLGSIFDSFTQADEGVNRKFGGTGLGLAIAKQLVEAMGSELKVESIEDRGSKFYFTLDLETSSTASYQNRASGQRPSFTSMKGVKVLLMEDYAVNVLVVTQFLNSWDIEVDVASNGVEGLQLMEQERYDLVLMDLEMPVMDGFEATEHIRKSASEVNRHVPVIAVTSSTSIAAKNKARAAGMNDFITKPFNPNELYKKIEKYVLNINPETVDTD